jgi:predicted dehydrogenase
VTSFGTRSDWQTEKRYGGGYLLNWGPHIIDPAVLLMGGKVQSVYAKLRQVHNPGDVEDLFLAVLTLADGATVLAEYTVAVENLPDWFIQGDRGTIVVRDNHIKIYKRIPPRPEDPTQFNTMQSEAAETLEETVAGNPYGDEHEIYAELAQALRGVKDFAVTPADALQLSRVFDAIRTSGEQNRVIALP